MKIKIFLKSKPKFSLIVLLIFVLVFTAIGIYIIFKSLAAERVDYFSGKYEIEGKSLVRIWGDNRYDTAAGISMDQYPNPVGGGTVILVSGENWPDSATASVLAHAYNSPILLTPKASLSRFTLQEIYRLRPSKVIIIGGTGAVSSTVETQLTSKIRGLRISRISGVNRYDTAARIATGVKNIKGSIPDATAFIVTGNNFPDVLTVGPVAAYKGYPILYVNSSATTLPSYTKRAIVNLGIKKTIVIGGTTAVSGTLFNQLPSPTRVYGTNRYVTSYNFAKWARANIPGFDWGNVGLATGDNFPDALVSGPYLASLDKPAILLLINNSNTQYLKYVAPRAKNIVVFGGSNVLSETTLKTIGQYMGAPYETELLEAQRLLDSKISQCPLLTGTTVLLGTTPDGHQAVVYFTVGRIVISPDHTTTLSRIIDHEIWHIIDYRYDGQINWGEMIPPSGRTLGDYCFQ